MTRALSNVNVPVPVPVHDCPAAPSAVGPVARSGGAGTFTGTCTCTGTGTLTLGRGERLGFILVGLALLLLVGCGKGRVDGTPEAAVRSMLERLENSSTDPRQTKEAYALMGPNARAQLQERAARATRLQGRRVEPYEMLAPGRFGLRFRPKRMKTQLMGDTATVTVEGTESAQSASISCVREAEGWRVEAEFPELPKVSAPAP